MEKELNFSRTYPAYHSDSGKPTYFIEAILSELGIKYKTGGYYKWLVDNNPKISKRFLLKFFDSLIRDVRPHGKGHTIRDHKRPLKTGDYIKPMCWAGKPYKKTEDGFWKIQFAPPIKIVKTWDYEVKCVPNYEQWFINNTRVSDCNKEDWFNAGIIETIAINDGLNISEFLEWFKHPSNFKGKIYCWNEKIEY